MRRALRERRLAPRLLLREKLRHHIYPRELRAYLPAAIPRRVRIPSGAAALHPAKSSRSGTAWWRWLAAAGSLKFLPEVLTQDSAALARFHAEVRTARQVSHPNVCRVFDIGDADGTLFLTMEYVDGEDLASVV